MQAGQILRAHHSVAVVHLLQLLLAQLLHPVGAPLQLVLPVLPRQLQLPAVEVHAGQRGCQRRLRRLPTQRELRARACAL